MSTEHSERTFAAGLTRHSDCNCCEHAAMEIARLTALIEKRWKDARVLSLGPDGRGAFQLSVQTDLAGLMADHLLAIMQAEGGPNFVQMEVDHPDMGPLTFSIERRLGRSAAEQLREAKLRIEELERKAAGEIEP